MMRGFTIPPYQVPEENMSNLTSASGDQASTVSSSQQQSSFASPNPNPAKKKRSLPGNPDPEAEVIALSPKTLMTRNRFLCEICNKGFQRDQNLQLHRRGHNLPWKLKQRSTKEVRKKVYICPEVSCVHHDSSRALGDLTGVKKHFSRKHGEKKWKCDKCSKKYAVQSDWKAHSKICGTREYRCDCGTLFSRRDSFITHRAFCDALTEESARANPLSNHSHPFLFSQPTTASPLDSSSLSFTSPMAHFPPHLMTGSSDLKRENQHHEFPPWLINNNNNIINNNNNNNSNSNDQNDCVAPPSAHMSATALLQKAAQMGATMTNFNSATANASTSVAFAGIGLSSHQQLQEMMVSPMSSSSVFDGSRFSFEGSSNVQMIGRREEGRNGGGGDEGMTRDFLGLQRSFSHRDILGMAGLDQCMASSYEQPQQNNKEQWS